MLNLVKNPNVTSSHLFRADIFYDSDNDRCLGHGNQPNSGLLRSLKRDYHPLKYDLPGFDLTRTIVRQLVPRNTLLDRPLVQTCHFFSKLDGLEEHSIVVYIPHARNAEDIPFYHPSVSRLAFEHRWRRSDSTDSSPNSANGSVSVSYCLFTATDLTTKLERTALRLLQTVHKHGQGQLAGYEKRVHLDQVIPQSQYQDTYTRLKNKYGSQLAEQWIEATDPGKHVFEDLGIAAFLIELWNDTYSFPQARHSINDEPNDEGTSKPRPRFPGFVDVGCGNGVLVYILLAEGYKGWGFDARERKTWRIFPEFTQERLLRRLLVPSVFPVSATEEAHEMLHDRVFEPGTFIISNHADELTAWTPLMAYLNKSLFIAIPCCSHDLAGARFRAPPTVKTRKQGAARLPQQMCSNPVDITECQKDLKKLQVAETGSLKRTDAQKKMPSAYSTLCSYVTSLAEEVGFEPEKEILRIPSTRNQCIIGRRCRDDIGAGTSDNAEQRKQKILEIVQRELGNHIEKIAADWIARVEKLARKPGSGH